jgi:hypothetical protein
MSPKATDTVTAHYTGWLTDGTVFDSSHARGEADRVPARPRHQGLDRRAAADAGRAASTCSRSPATSPTARGSPPKIPANATLVFLVELVDVKKQ